MNILIVTLLAAPMLMLAGCGEKAPASAAKTETETQTRLPDEFTSEKQIPSILENGLGVMYYTGEAISKDSSGKILSNDPVTAAAWFHRSAAQGYADAQFNLGLMYANGEGVAKDPLKAVELFRKSADQGNVDAENNLGVMYFAGEGIARDTDKAKEWFAKAAAQGNADAKANLDAMK